MIHLASIHDITFGLACILAVGVFAQWLSWRMHWPSIVVLIVFGVVLGPLTGWIKPDELFGEEWVRAIVAVGVAVILFEGGLSLRFSELAGNRVVWRLVLVGMAVTMVFSSVMAHHLLGYSWPVAWLWGAILSVTGPTVIVPLLRHLQLTKKVEVTLRWEGILNDPIGAILAVLIFEAAVSISDNTTVREMAINLGLSALWGVGGGVAGGLLVVPLFRKYWVPDHLKSPVALGVVLLVFVIANSLRAESGLLAVTVMGVFMANQKWIEIKRIAQFKETLSLVLIGFLFVLLSTQVTLDHMLSLGPASLGFVLILILVVRPVAVWLATLGTSVSIRHRIFFAAMSPRGIVAAAVVATFALDSNLQEIRSLVPLTFLVIAVTAVFSGIVAPILARWLGLSQGTRRGVILLGGSKWVRLLAETLMREGIEVRIVDDNWFGIHHARKENIPAMHLDILAIDAVDEMDRTGVGCVMAMMPNDERNILALDRLAEVFDRSELFLLHAHEPLPESAAIKRTDMNVEVGGRLLFKNDLNHAEMTVRIRMGWRFKVISVSDGEDRDEGDFKADANDAVDLIWIQDEKLIPEADRSTAKHSGRLVVLSPPSVVAT